MHGITRRRSVRTETNRVWGNQAAMSSPWTRLGHRGRLGNRRLSVGDVAALSVAEVRVRLAGVLRQHTKRTAIQRSQPFTTIHQLCGATGHVRACSKSPGHTSAGSRSQPSSSSPANAHAHARQRQHRLCVRARGRETSRWRVHDMEHAMKSSSRTPQEWQEYGGVLVGSCSESSHTNSQR